MLVHHYATDRAGDDVQFLSGGVVGKREEDGRKVVDLKMTMTNQRGVETSFADVTVCLPSRDTGQALLPAVPEDIQRQASVMYARHNELLAEKRAAVRAAERRHVSPRAGAR